MKKLLFIIIFVSTVVSITAPASNSIGLITVKKGILYSPIKGSVATSAYGLFKNKSDKDINLSIVKADGFKVVEMHETKEVDGMMKMQKINSISIKKSQKFEMKPGGYHIMLFEPIKDFKIDEVVQVTFSANGESFSLPFVVKERVKNKKSKKINEHNHHH